MRFPHRGTTCVLMPDLFDDPSDEKKHVAIAGNIGAGKTALTDVMG